MTRATRFRFLLLLALPTGMACFSPKPPAPEPLRHFGPTIPPDPPPDNGPAPAGWATFTREYSYEDGGWARVAGCPTKTQCPTPRALPPCGPLAALTPVESLEASKGKVVAVVGQPVTQGETALAVISRGPNGVECGRVEGSLRIIVEGRFTLFVHTYKFNDYPVHCYGDGTTMCCPVGMAGEVGVSGKLLLDGDDWHIVNPAMCRVKPAITVPDDGGK